jgi:hypothetical protein
MSKNLAIVKVEEITQVKGWKHNIKGGRGGEGGGFGQFHDMCIKYTFANVLHLILGFTFGVWVLYFDFQKLMLSNIILKF